MTKCKHCKRRVPQYGYRGLCRGCFNDRTIRERFGRYGKRSVPDQRGGHRLPSEPTTTRTGTEARIAVLAERAARGESLSHPADCTDCGAVKPPDEPNTRRHNVRELRVRKWHSPE